MYHLSTCSECISGSKYHKSICIFNNYYKQYDKLNTSQIKDGFKIMNLLCLRYNINICKVDILNRIQLYKNYSNDIIIFNNFKSILDDLKLNNLSYANIIDIISIVINSKNEYTTQLYSAYDATIKNYKKNMIILT